MSAMTDRRRETYEVGVIVSAEHALDILRARLRDMEEEDKRPFPRDTRVYAAGYGIASAISLLFKLQSDTPEDLIPELEKLVKEARA